MTNPIANLLNLPAAVTDGRTHIVTIDGVEFEYTAARDCYGEGLYRRAGGHGSSNACFKLGGNPARHAAELGRYLMGGSHQSNPVKVSQEAAEDAGRRAVAEVA